MINRPRVESMTDLRAKTRRNGRWATGHSGPVNRVCAIETCRRSFLGTGKSLYCSYACWLAAKRVTPIACAPEWRCGRFAELDRLIEMERRNGQADY